MVQLRLFGILISIHPWFWIVMAFIGGGIDAIEGRREFLLVFLFMLAGFISILVHELGHALTIKHYRMPTEIHLIAFGGLATHPPILDRKQSFLVTAAGPGAQLILGAMTFYLLQTLSLPNPLIGYFFESLMVVSIFWALLNCLPVYPLDGGQLLMAIMGPKREKIVYKVGIFLGILCALVAVQYSYFIAIFLSLFAYENWRRI